jgi:capsular exopolysaccharide synthesis family protein
MDEPSAKNELDIRQLTGIVLSRITLIIGVMLIVAMGTYFYAASSPNMYRATALIRVVDPNTQAVFDGTQIRIDPKRDVETQITLILSKDLRDEVKASMGDDAARMGKVSVANNGSTDIISISVVSRSPEVAAKAANAYAEIYVAKRKDLAQAEFRARADELRQKALASDVTAAQAQDLLSRATQYDIEAAIRSGSAEIVQSATVPTNPYSPKPVRDAAVAAVFGLLLGIGLAFLLDYLDDELHSPADIASIDRNLNVIGEISIVATDGKQHRKIETGMKRAIVKENSQAAEAYRALASNIRFAAIGEKRTRILVTSADMAEGKSTVTANLANTLAEIGKRVVVVSADLRRPTIGSFFDVDEKDKGITDVLLGDMTLEEVLVPVTLPSGNRIAVLPAGHVPQNAAQAVGLPQMKLMLDKLEETGADFILIDSPPLLPVADSLTLAQIVDGVILLAKVGGPIGGLKETVARLKRVNAEIIGVVVNGIPSRSRFGYGYGYRYGYRYGYGYRYRYGYRNKYGSGYGGGYGNGYGNDSNAYYSSTQAPSVDGTESESSSKPHWSET